MIDDEPKKRPFDPECKVNVVRGASRKLPIRAAMSNSMGFGGSNSCLVMRHPEAS